MEAARELGRRALGEGGASDPQRVDYAFRRVLSRTPHHAEREELLALLAGQRERIESGELDAAELAYGDTRDRVRNAGTADVAELAAWTAVSRVLLNLDETITRE